MKWKRYDTDNKFLPLHEDLAEGEHPKFGKFEVLRSLDGGQIFVKCEGETWMLTLRDMTDAFFDMKEKAARRQKRRKSA